MTQYTIGIIFNGNFEKVVLIKKKRPSWQEGRLNFPGGHVEMGEAPIDCVVREIKEECGADIPADKWTHIGQIYNDDVPYTVEIFTTCVISSSFYVKTCTDEEVAWYNTIELPSNVLSNLTWLVPFAKNYFVQGNRDKIEFGIFRYKN